MGVADHMPAFSQPERYGRSTVVQSERHATFSTKYKLPEIEFRLIPCRMCRHTSNIYRVIKKQLWQSEARGDGDSRAVKASRVLNHHFPGRVVALYFVFQGRP